VIDHGIFERIELGEGGALMPDCVGGHDDFPVEKSSYLSPVNHRYIAQIAIWRGVQAKNGLKGAPVLEF
jgi:hypothetical protein